MSTKILTPKQMRDELLANILKGNIIDIFLKVNRDAFRGVEGSVLHLLDKYLRAYKKLPDSAKLLKTYVNAEVSDVTEIGVMSNYIDKLYEYAPVSITDLNSYVDSINRIASLSMSKDLTEELADRVVSGNSDDITSKALEIARVSSMSTSKSPIDGVNTTYNPVNIATVESCMPTLKDKNIHLAGLSLISAISGGGKSVLTLKQLHHTFTVEKKSVCLINLELPLDEILARLYCMVNEKDFDKIYGNPIAKMQVDTWIGKYFSPAEGHKFYIASGSGYTDVELEGTILAMVAKGVKLLAVDYLNLVEPSEASKADSFMFMAQLAKRMHRLAVENKLVILSPVQVNSGDIKSGKTGDINITTRGSRELEYSCSLWLHVHSTPEERAEDLGRVFVIKSRNSMKHVIAIEFDLRKMNIRDDGDAV